jgi:hypothetical protein
MHTMPDHPATRTITGLDTMLAEIQFFLDHPRTQQNQWVAKGRIWKPVLEQAKMDLAAEAEHYSLLSEAYQAVWEVLRHLGSDDLGLYLARCAARGRICLTRSGARSCPS